MDSPVAPEKPSNKISDGVAYKVEGRGLTVDQLGALGGIWGWS